MEDVEDSGDYDQTSQLLHCVAVADIVKFL